jgi:hypothetical protein
MLLEPFAQRQAVSNSNWTMVILQSYVSSGSMVDLGLEIPTFYMSSAAEFILNPTVRQVQYKQIPAAQSPFYYT